MQGRERSKGGARRSSDGGWEGCRRPREEEDGSREVVLDSGGTVGKRTMRGVRGLNMLVVGCRGSEEAEVEAHGGGWGCQAVGVVERIECFDGTPEVEKVMRRRKKVKTYHSKGVGVMGAVVLAARVGVLSAKLGRM